MNTFTGIKRVISLVLALIMVVAMMPVNAHAATAGRESDTIFFATDRHEESSKLQSLLRALQYTPGLVVLGGDHVNNTNSGSLASITSEIQSVYPGVQTFYTYAAHDPNVSEDSSNPYAYARTGEYYEGEDYYVCRQLQQLVGQLVRQRHPEPQHHQFQHRFLQLQQAEGGLQLLPALFLRQCFPEPQRLHRLSVCGGISRFRKTAQYSAKSPSSEGLFWLFFYGRVIDKSWEEGYNVGYNAMIRRTRSILA